MTWRYSVLKYKDGTLGIHETYMVDGELACTVEPVGPVGDTLDEVRLDLKRMAECISKPVIEYESIGEEDGETAGIT